jgi:hypothetical protein
MVDKFAKLHAEAPFLTQDEFARFIAGEAERLGTLGRLSAAREE